MTVANNSHSSGQGQIVVITGSTRGIGFGMAQVFLERGCRVVVSGRQQSSVESAVAQLSALAPGDRLLGQACDVAEFAQVQALWDATVARFGRVDIWINNAGITTHDVKLWDLAPDTIKGVIDTNLIGVMYGCKVAINGMIRQGGGFIYNMEGYGSGGEVMDGNVPYGSTKYALRYLTKALIKETKGQPVKIGYLSPGMVTTDMLMGMIPPEREAQTKRIYNILADKVETVTPWLVDHILANDKAGAAFRWLTTPKILARFLMATVRKRDLFAE